MNKYAVSLVGLWLAALAYRLAVDDAPGGFTDWFSAVVFWLLTAALVGLALGGLAKHLRRRLRAAPEANLWLDSEGVKYALIGSFALGTVLRMTTWDGGGQTVIGWVGTGLCCVGLLGLLVFGYRREARQAKPGASLSERPGVKYGVIVFLLGTLLFQGLVQPSGALASVVALLGVGAFFVLLAYLARWIWRRGRGRAVAARGSH